MGDGMMKNWTIGLLAAGGFAACAICCAPLLAAPAALALSALGLGAAGLSYLACEDAGLMIGLLGVGGVGYLVWRSRTVREKATAAAGCACPPEGGCRTGDACDLPATTR